MYGVFRVTSLLPFSVFSQNFSDFSVSKRSLFYFPKKKRNRINSRLKKKKL